MMNRLKYIWMIILLTVATTAIAQEDYVIDSLCVGADRYYRIDGEKGSTYEWILTNSAGDTIKPAPAVSLFAEKDQVSGDSIFGSEVQISWIDPGIYELSTIQYSVHGCDTIEQGWIKVFETPEAYAGEDETVCANGSVSLVNATASNYGSLLWETSGDGSFDNDDQLNPTYNFGTNDKLAGNVQLILTANGLAENTTCSPAIDTIKVWLSNTEVTFDSTNLLCYNDNTGVIKANVIGGIEPYTFEWTGPDSYSASMDSIYDLAAGIYNVTIIDSIGCLTTGSVEITEPTELVIAITADLTEVCEGVAINLSGNPDGGTGLLTNLWTGNGAAYLNATDVTDPVFDMAPVGDYTLIYTVTDENGCLVKDSINLTVNPIFAENIDTTICASELPIVWESQNITAAGTYVESLTTISGCDSILTLNLFVNPVYNEIADLEVCESELPITWESQTLDTAGTYIENLTTIHGCDSILTLNLQVNPGYSDTTELVVCESELPVSWESYSLTESGIYSDTLSTIHGCDSILTINLQVNPIFAETIDSTICASELPIVWESQNITAAGTYVESLTTISGCDSILTLNLFVNPVYNEIADLEVCESELPITWESQTLDAVGTYIENLTTIDGCDSILTLNLQVHPVYIDTTDLVVCESELPISWESYSLTESGIYSDTLSTIYGCDSILTLNLQVNPIFAETIDSTICASELPIVWESQNITAAGTYVESLTTLSGCDSILTLNLIVNPEYSEITDLTVCESELPVIWEGDTLTGAGTYIDTLSTIAGCDSVLTLNLQVNPVYSDTTEMIVCDSELPISWESQNITAAGTYVENLTTASGCDSILTLYLNVNPVFHEVIDSAICESELPIIWESQTISAAGSYTESLASVLGCDSILTLNLNVNPEYDEITDMTVCESELPIIWEGDTLTESGIYIDSLSTIAGCDSILTLNLNINPVYSDTTEMMICESELPVMWGSQAISTEGYFTNTLSTIAGCDSILTLNLRISWQMSIQATATIASNSVAEDGEIEINISGGIGPYTYSWSNGDTTQNISGLDDGIYTLVVTDSISCTAATSVEIEAGQANYSITCLTEETYDCLDNVPPAYSNYAEFENAGGKVESDCGLDFASFTVTEIDDGRTCPKIISRKYKITDLCGNVIGCTQNIIVDDRVPPEIICPADSLVECLSVVPQEFTLQSFIEAGGTVSDNCALDSASFEVIFENTTQVAVNRIEIQRIYSIKDLCGNENNCVHNIILTDTIPPEAVCNDITVYLDDNGNYLLTEVDIQNISAGSNDNCTNPEDLIVEIDITEFSCVDVEDSVQINVVVTDAVGNSSECVASITVVDSIPPTAVCKDVTVYLDENGKAGIDVSQIDNGSFDNCKIDTIYISQDSFDCSNVGNNAVQLIVIDDALLVSECTANVTVLDTIAPMVTCLDTFVQLDNNGEYRLTVEELVDSSYDICGIDTLFLDNYILDCSNVGTTLITVSAYDVNGNYGECISTITVYGNIAPTALNDSAIVIMNELVEIDILANDYDTTTSIDVSSLTITEQPHNGTIEVNPGNGVITYMPDFDYYGTDSLIYLVYDDGIPCEPLPDTALVYIEVRKANLAPNAVNDTITATCWTTTGNMLSNDTDPEDDQLFVNTVPVEQPDYGQVVIYADGTFDYTPDGTYIGIDSFVYEICDSGLPSRCDSATVFIEILPDNDCDGVTDSDDIDDDNDGILDIVEGDTRIDSDLDGIPDSYDIDSDDDGIVDNEEGQYEGNYIAPIGVDSNNNGWDDAYDPEEGGIEFAPADTDEDSTPDFLDLDSDGDHVFDFIEGHDSNADGIPDVIRIYVDSDRDGLDDIYDTIFGWNDPDSPENSTGSNAPLQDFDQDGYRDWRDQNDENDEYMTKDEDLNGDGDYSNDDWDLDGFPEYLDNTLDCELFIPEGFSPNGDDVHDFFQILCIQKYPNAKLMIFNRNGDLLFEKEHYGNLDYWGSDEEAWWWGISEHKWTIGQSKGLPAGNYVYVLELGNGKSEKGTVMVAY